MWYLAPPPPLFNNPPPPPRPHRTPNSILIPTPTPNPLLLLLLPPLSVASACRWRLIPGPVVCCYPGSPGRVAHAGRTNRRKRDLRADSTHTQKHTHTQTRTPPSCSSLFSVHVFPPSASFLSLSLRLSILICSSRHWPLPPQRSADLGSGTTVRRSADI